MEELKAKIADLRSHTKGRINESEEIIQRTFETGRALREGVKQCQQVFSQLSSIMSEYTLCVRSVGFQPAMRADS